MSFLDKLLTVQQQNHSWIGLRLDIWRSRMPLPLAQLDDPLLPFAKTMIDATHDLVCAYVLDPACFLAEGAAGMIALERLVRYVPTHIPIVLDTCFGSIASSAEWYARAAFEAFSADAVTFSVVPDPATLETFTRVDNKAAFVPALALLTQAPLLNRSGLLIHASDLAHIQLTAIKAPILITDWNATEETRAAKTIGVSGLNPIIDIGSAALYTSHHEDFAEAARLIVRQTRNRLNTYRPTALAAL